MHYYAIAGSETGPGAIVTGVVGGVIGGFVGEAGMKKAFDEFNK